MTQVSSVLSTPAASTRSMRLAAKGGGAATTRERVDVRTVCSRVAEGRIIVPDWHRNYLWTEREASALVESVLLDIPVQMVYIARGPDGVDEVVDGHQRLRALSLFADGKLRLRDLQLRVDLVGRLFSDLPEADQQQFLEALLHIAVFHDASVALRITFYERMNARSRLRRAPRSSCPDSRR